MSLIRSPTETDPLMSQSTRRDFPASLERIVVDGGVAEGRPESPGLPGMVNLSTVALLALTVLVVILLVALAMGWFSLPHR